MRDPKKAGDIGYLSPEQVQSLAETGQLPVPAEDTPINFEIALNCSTEWPIACIGVRPVASAVQKLLLAAAHANMENFSAAEAELSEAVFDWRVFLFGEEPKP